MRAKDRTKKFEVFYTEQEHATVKRRSNAAGSSMHAYIVAMTVDGTLPKPKRTSPK